MGEARLGWKREARREARQGERGRQGEREEARDGADFGADSTGGGIARHRARPSHAIVFCRRGVRGHEAGLWEEGD